MPGPSLTPRQLAITLTIASVQFINILDFVVIMPLGPMYAPALGLPESSLGLVNASYTAAACVAGLVGSLFLDRFDRRVVLAVAISGLVVGTALCGLAQDANMLLAARVLAGAFGGPATSTSFAIIADAIPNNVRGRAMGMVMAAFSVASVLGVPAGLFLAEAFSWRAPFFTIAGVGVVIIFFAIGSLPRMRDHLDGPKVEAVTTRELVKRPLVQLSYLMTATVMTAGFVLIPNIAPYLTLNLLMPQSDLKWGYLFGGFVSFAATQLGGRFVDKFGSFKVGTFGAAIFAVTVFVVFFVPWTVLSTPLIVFGFMGVMLGLGLRNVSYNTLTSKVPEGPVRARFQSLQSAVQHAASATAAFTSAQLMTTALRPDGKGDMLVGMPRVAGLAIGLSVLVPIMLSIVERRVKAQQAAAEPVPVPVPAR